MLVRCNLNCKLDVTTDALLDPETDDAICSRCGDILDGVSSYAKKAMKSNGDILRKNKSKSFTFDCTFCNKSKKCISNGSKIVGVGCENQDSCDFAISGYMKRAVEMYSVEEDGGFDDEKE